MSERLDYCYVTNPKQAERLARLRHKLPPYENGPMAVSDGTVSSGHPVDVMLAVGVVMTPEQKARLRAYCDEPVELDCDERRNP